MNRDDLYRGIGEVEDELLERSETAAPGRKKRTWLMWGAAAACLCLAVAGAIGLMTPDGGRPVLQWSETFAAEDYFRYNWEATAETVEHTISDSAVPYAEQRFFSDHRQQMEADGVIPVLADHPLYDCVVNYNGDGSIFSVTHAWHQRGDHYSYLTITIGRQPVELIEDCISVEVDENGNIVPPAVTVTERDGVRIVAEGNENREKTVTFQTETAWYQIAGSGSDGYAALAALLDWVWEHPVDFAVFARERGTVYTTVQLADDPAAFSAQRPDLEPLGYFLGEHYLQQKDGMPCAFEGHYYTGVTPEQVEDGSHYGLTGWTEIHWCIDAQPDYYDLQQSIGSLWELTQEQTVQTLTEEGRVSFSLDDVLITVYCKNPAEAWRAMETLKN